MDIEVAYRQALSAWADLRREVESDQGSGVEVAGAREMVDAFEAIDVWLRNGGFMPAAWCAGHESWRDR